MAKFYLDQTWKGKVTNFVGKVIDFANTEVNPITRKRMSDEAEQRRKAKAETRKRKAERRAKSKQLKIDGDTAIKHAEQKLHARGFVIVDK